MIWLLCFSLLFLFLFAFLFDFHLGAVVYMKWRLTNALYVCMYVCMGAPKSLGKLTKRYQGQIMVKNTLKVVNSLGALRPNPKRAGNGIGGLGEI